MVVIPSKGLTEPVDWLERPTGNRPGSPRRALRLTARLRPSRRDPGAAVVPTACIPGWDGPGDGASGGPGRRGRRRGNPSRAAALRPVCHAGPFLSVRRETGFFLLRRCSLLNSEISRVAGARLSCNSMGCQCRWSKCRAAQRDSPECSICCATAASGRECTVPCARLTSQFVSTRRSVSPQARPLTPGQCTSTLTCPRRSSKRSFSAWIPGGASSSMTPASSRK